MGIIHPSNELNVIRAVFIVDPNGIIRFILLYPQELSRNIDEIIRIVRALKITDEENVLVPADWPENELIGQQVIVPPPTNEKTAELRT
ncbi:MAG: hypothetical protein ACFFG0_52610 [Candidatus Thorarchaeota archaeon]